MRWQSCFVWVFIWLASCKPGPSPDNPSPPKSPTEELASFQLPSDLEIKLVAAEPMVQDPVALSFDAKGRLWVVEMRGFMPDIDGTGENNPTGRISILSDTDGDGVMDHSVIYLDSLILPRSMAIVDGGALVVDDYKLWLTRDTDGDDIADTKTLIDSTYGGTRLPEHSGNGLLRGLDNWYYNARSAVRYKLEGETIQRDSTEFRGQWGISQDDEGRLYYNYNWSQLHADLVPPNYLGRNHQHEATSGIDHGLTLDRRIYPIRPNPAVNRGYIPGTLDHEGKLLEFTAACSPFVYRAHTLPSGYYGNAFVCEPSGNLIKRNVIREMGFNLSAYDPNPGYEFLASTDERFRPVSMTTGPDGALYVADMYRGLVQHGEYVTPYLREQTLKRKLDAPVHFGRIWKLVPKKHRERLAIDYSTLNTSTLIDSLGSPNGFVRDLVQRLIVERADSKQFGSQLESMARSSPNPLARLHAVWTLEGLHLVKPDLLVHIFSEDQSVVVRNAALRLLEPYMLKEKEIQRLVTEQLRVRLKRSDAKELLQFVLSTPSLRKDDRMEVLEFALTKRDTPVALIQDAVLSSISGEEIDLANRLLVSPTWQEEDAFRSTFLEMIASTVVQRRQNGEIETLLTIVNRELTSPSYQSTALLAGIAIHSRGKWQPLMLPKRPAVLNANLTPSQKKAVEQMFEWPGHRVDVQAVVAANKLDEGQQKLFVAGRQQFLSVCAGCHGTDGAGVKRLGPPLAGSEWVVGDPRRLALIVLHGIEGPMEVAGKRYETPDILPTMPSHSTMDDGAITAILTYIRNEWGNEAGAPERRLVGKLRHTTQGRVQPWNVKDLESHVSSLDSAK